MGHRSLLVAVCAASVALAACSSTGEAGGSCVPGMLVTCACPTGSGAHACGPDREFGACDCTANAGAVPDPTGRADFVLDFGATLVGDRASATVPLWNAGATALQFQAEPVNAPFEVVSAAPVLVRPGEGGQLGWSFWPAAAGTFSEIARVRSSDGEVTVRLVGEAFEPALDCEPAEVSFGNASLGDVRRKEVVCVNTARHPWSLRAGPIVGEDWDVFTIAAPATSEPVAPGGTWTFSLEARPARPGTLSATLPLASTAGRPAGELPLRVVGISYGLACAPLSIDFGFVELGTTREVPVVCSNVSPLPIQITSVTLDVASDDAFAWVPTEYPIVVPGRVGEEEGTATLRASFSPAVEDAGARLWGRLLLRVDDPTTPEIGVTLAGSAGGPRISCSPAELDFGIVAKDLPATRSFVCGNVGVDNPARNDDELVIGLVETTRPAEFRAEVRGGVQGEGYGVGETFTVDVTYNPVDDGIDTALVNLASNALDVGEVPFAVPVTARGLDLPPCEFQVAPASQLRFGVVDRGSSATLEFAIRNSRIDAECVVQDLRLGAGCDGDYSLPGGEIAQAVLPPGGELRVPVRFAPRAYRAAAYLCDVLFDVSNASAPHQVVPVRGASSEPCALIAPGDLDFGTVKPGCGTVAREFQIINTCSAPLVVAGFEPVSVSDEFALRSVPPAGTIVPPGLGVTFTMAYRPIDEGVDLGGVHVSVDGSAEPYLATLRGRAGLDASQTDSFEQNDRPKVDVLWVIDNSAGMAEEQAAIAANLRPFLSFAQAQEIDYQIGITTTGLHSPCGNPGGAGGAEDGRLFPVDNARPRILTPNTPNFEAIWMANVQVGSCHYDEQGLEAAYRALHAPVIDSCDDPRHPEPNDGNCGFLRRPAHLSIIEVTDEVDQSPGTVNFYLNAFQILKGVGHPQLFNFHAITGDRAVGCSSTAGVAQGGDRLIDLVERTQGGLFQSLCAPDWEAKLRNLSAAAFGQRLCYYLRGVPEDSNASGTISDTEGELRVLLNGMVTPSYDGRPIWSYVPAQRAVCFEPLALPEPGTQIDVEYRVACLAW